MFKPIAMFLLLSLMTILFILLYKKDMKLIDRKILITDFFVTFLGCNVYI